MKQIIPFKKELLFKTKVNEITSISLEHTLSLTDNNSIAGEFQINGDYKMTASSINRENFEFTIPFEIELDSKYNKDEITIDIDNFYYEIINNETLKVNIDLYIEGEPEEREKIITPPIEEEVIKIIPEKEEIIEEEQQDFNIFDNIDNSETYVTYHIYIVKEEDTIDKIMEKFNVNKEDISQYNNIEEISKGTKLIIPNKNE